MTNPKPSLRVLFAGTPEFALPPLQALIDEGCEIVAVLTQPDRPAGRGKRLRASPVKELALENKLTVLQPESLKDAAWQEKLAALQPDLMVVVAYGLMIPGVLLTTPRFGCWNIHASLLPRWRGAAPIHRAIEAGDEQTGVCIMQMEVTLDTGPVYHCLTTQVTALDTAGSLHDRLAVLGARALRECIEMLVRGDLPKAISQDDTLAVYASKLSKAEAELDWSQPADVLERRIRAFNPWPVSWCEIGGQRLRIWKAEVVESEADCKPGQIVIDRQSLLIGTAEKTLKVLELQRAGGQRMTAEQFLNAQKTKDLIKTMPKNKKNWQNPRLAAIQALSEVLDENKNLGDSQALSNLRDSRDNALARNLAYGVLRWMSALEWLAGELLSKPIKKREVQVQRLLLLGLQQLWHDQTASHAAVNETAECARLLGKPWAVGLINAVLRRFQREQEVFLKKMEQSEKQYAHPGWLLNEIRKDWPEQWQGIIDANNRQAPLWLRINRQRADETKLRSDLKSAGFATNDHAFARDAICISPAAPVAKIPGFEEGWLSVQDPAAQLARDLLAPKSGDRILDACAAPGGKTAHLLESCEDIKLTVLDRQPQRIEQIDQNLHRLGLKAETVAADATDIETWWNGEKFNKILLDAPCSATGVIRRHPEIKWLRSSGQVDTVVQIQAGLLTALWALLEPGGLLVYATCSILKRENSEQIHQFLKQHPDAEVEVPDVEWGTASPYGHQILPGEARMDGFFYAVLRKSA